jgi:hypothetical protein
VLFELATGRLPYGRRAPTTSPTCRPSPLVTRALRRCWPRPSQRCEPRGGSRVQDTFSMS